MLKIGEFIYPWGGGHHSRMMRFNAELPKFTEKKYEIHFSSKGHIYQKLLKEFPDKREQIHNILMPTPIDGNFGPSAWLSMLNILLPVSGNPPLVKQIADYLREERRLYDEQKFDLVINDGDMGSNVLAKNRNIHSLFVTNQFRPKLYRSHMHFYPSMTFVAKQIAKASQIIVADSPPPYTMCEYNLNFTDDIKGKVKYVGHFTGSQTRKKVPQTDLERLVTDSEFGYWVRTGNKSTNDGTGKRYEQVFARDEMREERRIISHARRDSSIDVVLGKDQKRYGISEALEKKIDWIQIDVGFLSEQEKDTILDACKYAVVNGSHTVMGEILGGKARPIIGMPIYDEHTNNIRWAQDKGLGILATETRQVVRAIADIRHKYDKFIENLEDFARNFVGNGAANTAEIAGQILEEKR